MIKNHNVAYAGLVEKYVGTAYDSVKVCADNIEWIILVGENWEYFEGISEYLWEMVLACRKSVLDAGLYAAEAEKYAADAQVILGECTKSEAKALIYSTASGKFAEISTAEAVKAITASVVAVEAARQAAISAEEAGSHNHEVELLVAAAVISAAVASDAAQTAVDSSTSASASAYVSSQKATESSASAVISSESSEAALSYALRAEAAAVTSLSPVRSGGYFDPALGVYPVPAGDDVSYPWHWASTSIGTIDTTTWGIGDTLSYVPDSTDPLGTIGAYYRIAGELTVPGTPQPIEFLTDVVLASGTKLVTKSQAGLETYSMLQMLPDDASLVLGDRGVGDDLSPVLSVSIVSKDDLTHVTATDVNGAVTEEFKVVTNRYGEVSIEGHTHTEFIPTLNPVIEGQLWVNGGPITIRATAADNVETHYRSIDNVMMGSMVSELGTNKISITRYSLTGGDVVTELVLDSGGNILAPSGSGVPTKGRHLITNEYLTWYVSDYFDGIDPSLYITLEESDLKDAIVKADSSAYTSQEVQASYERVTGETDIKLDELLLEAQEFANNADVLVLRAANDYTDAEIITYDVYAKTYFASKAEREAGDIASEENSKEYTDTVVEDFVNGQFAELVGRVDSIAVQVEQNVIAIQDNRTEIEANLASIELLKTRVAANELAIISLDGRVTALENGDNLDAKYLAHVGDEIKEGQLTVTNLFVKV